MPFSRRWRLPAARRRRSDRFSDAEIRTIDRIISDPRFDVHVAKSDDKLRRIAGQLKFDDRSAKGTLSFAFTYSNVDEEVEIDAPEGKTRPIDDLFARMGVEG